MSVASAPSIREPHPLGQFIRARRQELGQSLFETAVPSGVTPTAIQSIEEGRARNPKVRTLAGLARGLQVDLSTLTDLALQ